MLNFMFIIIVESNKIYKKTNVNKFSPVVNNFNFKRLKKSLNNNLYDIHILINF